MDTSIETNRLRLSAPKLSDVPALFKILGNRHALQYTHCDATLRDCRRRIAVHERMRRHNGVAPWTVQLKKTHEIIGWGGLYKDPFDPSWGIELAYFFHQSVWGQGYATELCHAALEVSDRYLKLEKLSAFAHPQNTASHALLKKMGFEHERFIKDMERHLYNRNRPYQTGSQARRPHFQCSTHSAVRT